MKDKDIKKEYDTPKAEKLEFDYNKAVVASNQKCFIGGSSAYWNDSNGNCETHAPGDD